MFSYKEKALLSFQYISLFTGKIDGLVYNNNNSKINIDNNIYYSYVLQ